MSQIGIKVTADAESIQAYCHNVEGMLKTIYNDQLRKVKAINILKRIEKVVNIIGLLLATCCVVDFFVKFIPKFFFGYISCYGCIFYYHHCNVHFGGTDL